MRKVLWLTSLLLCACLLLAPLLAPYDPAEQHRSAAMQPPTTLHFTFASGLSVFAGDSNTPVRVFARPLHVVGVSQPAHLFLFGTDEFGRDLFSRFLYGGRRALLVGLLGALTATSLGLIIGSLAGLSFGSSSRIQRWLDPLLMRLSELFLSMPWIYLLLSLRALMPVNISQGASVAIIVAVSALAGWARPARVIRGVVLSVNQRPFLFVARSLGAGNTHIILRHLLPHLKGVISAQFTSLIPQFMLVDITLSFLGLGDDANTASWGTMLTSLRHLAVIESHIGYPLMAASILIVLVVLQLAADLRS